MLLCFELRSVKRFCVYSYFLSSLGFQNSLVFVLNKCLQCSSRWRKLYHRTSLVNSKLMLRRRHVHETHRKAATSLRLVSEDDKVDSSVVQRQRLTFALRLDGLQIRILRDDAHSLSCKARGINQSPFNFLFAYFIYKLQYHSSPRTPPISTLPK